MKAYSADLCAKIAQACDEGIASRRQLARQFRVSVAFIQKMLRRRRLTGRPAAAVHTGGRRGLLDADALALGGTSPPWAERPDARRAVRTCGR